MKTIHVILRTCDRCNVHVDWRVRFCDMPKIDLIKGCYQSLLNTIAAVTNHHIKLTVLDDHSSDELKNHIKQVSAHLPDFEFVELPEYGYNYSALKQFELCRDTQADLVYSVEDDYLHQLSALQEMIDSYYLFAAKLEKTAIVLYPFDAPEEYDPPKHTCFVVHGSARHWRTGEFTTNVMFAPPEIFRDNWQPFEFLAKHYNGDYLTPLPEGTIRWGEENTIWNIWNSGRATRFNPVPSLALHLQFDKQIDPFIDWKKWWDEYTK